MDGGDCFRSAQRAQGSTYRQLGICFVIFAATHALLINTIFSAKVGANSSFEAGSVVIGDTSFHNRSEFNFTEDEDPLDEDHYSKHLVGMITLFPNNARLCDQALQIIIQGNSYKCPDPTCVECRQDKIREFEKLKNAFLSSSLRKPRQAALSDWFPNTEIPIIIVSVNYAQLYLFLNWACSCEANDVFDPRSYTWIIAMDSKTFSILNRMGFHVEPTNWLKKLNEIGGDNIDMGGQYHTNSMGRSHSKINTVTTMAVNFAVGLDYPVLQMDVDVVFLRNPFPYLKRASKRRHVLGMLAPRKDDAGYMNTGFMYFRPSKITKILLQSFENLSALKTFGDQELFNIILRHHKMRQVSQRILPEKLFLKLGMSTKGIEKVISNGTDDIYIFHVPSIFKASRLMMADQWYLNPPKSSNDKCTFWNKEVYMFSQQNIEAKANKR